MPFFLSRRDTDSQEQMDSPHCDIDALNNTYKQFKIINGFISRWRRVYVQQIRPLLMNANRPCSLLDIGFGGGDIPIKLAEWTTEDGIDLNITAIDTDVRAYNYATSFNTRDNITYLQQSSSQLVAAGEKYDIVISNHLLHHLSHTELLTLLREAQKLSRRAVFFNDIERSDLGYLLFNIFARPIFRSSFITSDGLTSIKRSYTMQELQQVTPDRWNTQRLFPFRLLLSFHHE